MNNKAQSHEEASALLFIGKQFESIKLLTSWLTRSNNKKKEMSKYEFC